MGIFRGKLDSNKPILGVQCAVYTIDTEERLDVTIADDNGYYFFKDLPDGNYQVRFYGRGYTNDDWVTITVLDGVNANSNFIEIVLDQEPNRNNWFNEVIGWTLQYDSEEFDAQFKIWAPEYLISDGDPPLPNFENPEINNVSISSDTTSLTVDYDLSSTPDELYYSIEEGQQLYSDNIGIQTEPPTWSNWDGVARQISITGRWIIQARVVDKRTGKVAGVAEKQISLDLTHPVWSNTDLVSIGTGAGGIRVTWDKTNPTSTFSTNIESYSGNHVLRVRGSFTDNYDNSFTLGEFPEGQKYFQYVSLVEQWLYIFVDVANEADNASNNIADFGGPYQLYSMTPSNLDDELTTIYEDQAAYNSSYYQVIYSLSNRTNMVQILTKAAGDIEEVQYIKYNPDFEPGGLESGGNIGQYRNWQNVEDLKIDDNTVTLPFSTETGKMHILKFKKVQTKGIRVKFSTSANSILADYNPETGVKGFNVVESLAAETFVGQTFEFQRNIRFLNDLGPERMIFDKFGLTGYKDINEYVNWVQIDDPEEAPAIPYEGDPFPAPTFYLGLNGEFFVGHKNYPNVSDSYIHFNPQTGQFEIDAVVRIKPDSEGLSNFKGYIPPEDLTWDNIEFKPRRFDISEYYPLPVPPETDASGLYLSEYFIGFYKQTTEVPDFWAGYDGTVDPPGYWPVFIRRDGSFAFTSGDDKGLRYLTGDDSVLIDVTRFTLKGYIQGEGGLEIDSAQKHFVNLTGSDVEGVKWNFKIKADLSAAEFASETGDTALDSGSSVIVTGGTLEVNNPQGIGSNTTAATPLTGFDELSISHIEYTINFPVDEYFPAIITGNITFEGKKGGRWVPLKSVWLDGAQGESIIETWTGSLKDYTDVRFSWNDSVHTRVIIPNASLTQYKSKTLINSEGFFLKQSPGNVVPLVLSDGSSGGGGGYVDLTGYATLEDISNAQISFTAINGITINPSGTDPSHFMLNQSTGRGFEFGVDYTTLGTTLAGGFTNAENQGGEADTTTGLYWDSFGDQMHISSGWVTGLVGNTFATTEYVDTEISVARRVTVKANQSTPSVAVFDDGVIDLRAAEPITLALNNTGTPELPIWNVTIGTTLSDPNDGLLTLSSTQVLNSATGAVTPVGLGTTTTFSANQSTRSDIELTFDYTVAGTWLSGNKSTADNPAHSTDTTTGLYWDAAGDQLHVSSQWLRGQLDSIYATPEDVAAAEKIEIQANGVSTPVAVFDDGVIDLRAAEPITLALNNTGTPELPIWNVTIGTTLSDPNDGLLTLSSTQVLNSATGAVTPVGLGTTTTFSANQSTRSDIELTFDYTVAGTWLAGNQTQIEVTDTESLYWNTSNDRLEVNSGWVTNQVDSSITSAANAAKMTRVIVDEATAQPAEFSDGNIDLRPGNNINIVADTSGGVGTHFVTINYDGPIYTHPSDGGGSLGGLTGASVISGITVNTAGHVTGTTTRNLTKADISLGNVPNSNNLSDFVNGPGYLTATDALSSSGGTLDGGINTTLTILSDDTGSSTLNLYGNSQGTGRIYVGQSTLYGGGIEYNGDNSPTTTGAGSDYITLWRRSNGVDEWTARNLHNSDNWEFRADVTVGGTSYATDHVSPSDSRVKTIHKVGNPLKLLEGVQVYNFTKRDSAESQWGIIAQELELNDRDLVGTQADDQFGEILNVSALSVASVAAAGVNELHALIKKQNKRIKELEGKLNDI